MLKKMSIKKITITTTALLVFLLFSIFPSKQSIANNINIKYEDAEKNSVVFLLNENDYLVRVNVYIEQTKKEEKINSKINYLIKNNKSIDSFMGLLPSNTKVLNIEIKDKCVIVNFSKEFLDMDIDKEENIIESLVYSLTEEDNIESISIYVENNLLTELPNSKKKIPEFLDRSYGINKEYDITSLVNLTSTTIYYTSVVNNEVYYVPVTKISNDNTEKIDIIINELKSSLIYQSNLNSYLKSDVKLKNYEITEETINLYFNENIFDDLNSKTILEEVKYTITQSIKENYEVEKVEFYVNDMLVN